MFLETFTKLLEDNSLSKSQFSARSGIPYTTIDGFYKKGYENIRLTTLRKIADFFDVTIDYLVNGDSNKGNEFSKVFVLYDSLNELGKSKVDEYIKDLSGNPKYIDST